MRVRIRSGVFGGLVGDARQAFGRGRYHVRFGKSAGTIRAGVDYLFTLDEFDPA